MDWHVTQRLNHPLVGHIWQPQAQTWATPNELRAAVSKAHFVLLGETHDNPDHHRLQAQLLKAMVTSGRHPTVAFEMLDLGQQPALTEFLRDHPDDADALGPAVNWAATGWPAWSNYAPIARVALKHKLKIVAANLSSKTVKAVAFKGYEALDPDMIAKLGLNKPWPESRRDILRERLYVSHCKLVPKSALTGMIHAQRTRNAIMAMRLVGTSGSGGAVLITGSGHARKDYGVPLNLRHDAPSSTVLSVALIEVKRGKFEPSDYASAFSVRQLPFDYVIFTPAAERKDPCKQLRKRFSNSSSKQPHKS